MDKLKFLAVKEIAIYQEGDGCMSKSCEQGGGRGERK